MSEAWFSALGEALADDERSEIAGYLAGLGIAVVVHQVKTWDQARKLCQTPSHEWWRAEEHARAELERGARLDPADPEWLALNEAWLARAAGAAGHHPFLRKYTLYGGGRWPLGIYDGAFAIF